MIQTALHTLSTSAEMIATAENASSTDKVSVLVSSPSAEVYIGGADVTAANGVVLGTGATLSIDLAGGDSLYAIAGSGTPTVRVMTTRTGYVAP